MEDITVLMVDDEYRMRKLVKDFLVKENFEVLEAEDGEKDSRGYSVFGWVNADNCEKIYEKEQEINGEKMVGRFTMKELREMLLEEIEERGGLTMREKLKVRPSEMQKTTQEQTTQERTTEKEMEM